MTDHTGRCPECGAVLPPEYEPPQHEPGRNEEPGRFRDAIIESVAPVARASITTVVLVTFLLAGTAVGHVAFHRTAGSVLGALICLTLAAAVWYGRRATSRDHTDQ